jgi:maleylpyruvate isomerase
VRHGRTRRVGQRIGQTQPINQDNHGTVTLELLIAATEALDCDVAQLDHRALSLPSALPGWSRAHVLTHLARNADGLRNLLLAARAGVGLRMYASSRARAADIEAGASRPADVVTADVLESDRRFLAEVGAMPIEAWEVLVAFTSGDPDPPLIPASSIVDMRLNEVAIHHVDLELGYGFSDVPAPVAEVLIRRYVHRYANQGVDVDGVEGPLSDQLAWLAGRGVGDSLSGRGGGPLPVLPNLG